MRSQMHEVVHGHLVVTEAKKQVKVIRQHGAVMGARHRPNCGIDKSKVFVEPILCSSRAGHFRFLQQRNGFPQNAPGQQPF
jgi:hypothetical protein